MSLITVAICTHNRAADVGECLAALMPQASASSPILIVDSASDPAQSKALQALAAEHGVRFQRLEEPGLSLARNLALKTADTEWVVYLDDDAVPAPRWMVNVTDVLSAVAADVAIVGGKISPRWPAGADPSHVTERWKLLLSCTERDGSGRVRDGFNICGANLAVRRSALEQIGLFPTRLGRIGKRLLSGEESYVIERLEAAGFEALYNDAFVVEHRIAPERLQVSWAARRAYWEGVSRVRIAQELSRQNGRLLLNSKLTASVLVHFALYTASRRPDFAIRYKMAAGSLLADLGFL